MLEWILRVSLRNRMLVVLGSLLIAVLGTLTALRRPIDVLPDLNRPVVTIMTEAPGMVPEDVEVLVSWPIEQVVNGATSVFRVRSASGQGLSVVKVEFDWGTDIYKDRQIVSEKLQLAIPSLPPGILPVMAPISSVMGQVQLIGFEDPTGKTDITTLRRLVDRDLKPRILSISGVAQVVTIGGQATEVQVIASRDRMRALGVTLHELEMAVQRANVSVSGAPMTIGAKGPIVNASGLVRDPEEIAKAVVRWPEEKGAGHRPIRVEDVAELRFGPSSIRTGDAGMNGKRAVLMLITKQPGVDTVALTERVGKELDAAKDELPKGVIVKDDLFQQAAFIHRAIDNVLEAVLIGALLVVLVLFAFLLDLRTTFITLTAIPMSIAITALVFAAFDLTINTMTLGGLAVAIGTLVDDAIVGVENVFRRVHENLFREEPRPFASLVFEASSEVRKPVLYGTLLVVVVYLPLFFLSGLEGKLFAPIGLAYIISIFASLLVSLSLTPVLCYYLLRPKSAQAKRHGSFVVHALSRIAGRSIRGCLRRAPLVVGLVAALSLSTMALLLGRGSSFLPEFNEGAAQVALILPPDTSLDTADAFGQRLEKLLLSVDGIQSVARRTGRAAGDEHAMPTSVTEAIVSFDPDSTLSRDAVIEEIRERVGKEFPGVAAATEQPLAHLLSALLSGVTAQVAIKISGPDLRVLRNFAEEVEAAASSIDGVRDLYTEPQVLIDQVEVKPRRLRLAEEGISAAVVSETVALAFGAERVSRLQDGRISYPITVRLRAEDRKGPRQIRELYVRRPDGSRIPLGDLCEVRISKTPNNINRENAMRRIVVQHNVGDRSLGEVVADLERALLPIRAKLAETPGYTLRVSGQFEAQQEAGRLLFWLGLGALLLMVLILHAHFRSVRLAMLVLLSRPVAFVGATLFVVLTDQVLSVATLVGFIALLGISARNAILLVDRYLSGMRDEGRSFGPWLLIEAGRERLVPILMTALTSGIGLLPLVLAADQPGRELLYPVATVIIGGLLSGTLLDFLVTPCLFLLFGRAALHKHGRASS